MGAPAAGDGQQVSGAWAKGGRPVVGEGTTGTEPSAQELVAAEGECSERCVDGH